MAGGQAHRNERCESGCMSGQNRQCRSVRHHKEPSNGTDDLSRRLAAMQSEAVLPEYSHWLKEPFAGILQGP